MALKVHIWIGVVPKRVCSIVAERIRDQIRVVSCSVHSQGTFRWRTPVGLLVSDNQPRTRVCHFCRTMRISQRNLKKTHSDKHIHTQTHRQTQPYADSHTQTHTRRLTCADSHRYTHTHGHSHTDWTHRHTQTQTHRHVQTHRHAQTRTDTDGHTHTHTHTNTPQTHTHTDSQTHTDSHRHTQTRADSQTGTDRQTLTHTHTQTHRRLTHTQTHRHTQTHAGSQTHTDSQTHTHTTHTLLPPTCRHSNCFPESQFYGQPFPSSVFPFLMLCSFMMFTVSFCSRQSSLLESFLRPLLWHPQRILSFENKRTWFRYILS
jgi:hypothetical protein